MSTAWSWVVSKLLAVLELHILWYLEVVANPGTNLTFPSAGPTDFHYIQRYPGSYLPEHRRSMKVLQWAYTSLYISKISVLSIFPIFPLTFPIFPLDVGGNTSIVNVGNIGNIVTVSGKIEDTKIVDDKRQRMLRSPKIYCIFSPLLSILGSAQ